MANGKFQYNMEFLQWLFDYAYKVASPNTLSSYKSRGGNYLFTQGARLTAATVNYIQAQDIAPKVVI